MVWSEKQLRNVINLRSDLKVSNVGTLARSFSVCALSLNHIRIDLFKLADFLSRYHSRGISRHLHSPQSGFCRLNKHNNSIKRTTARWMMNYETASTNSFGRLESYFGRFLIASALRHTTDHKAREISFCLLVVRGMMMRNSPLKSIFKRRQRKKSRRNKSNGSIQLNRPRYLRMCYKAFAARASSPCVCYE